MKKIIYSLIFLLSYIRLYPFIQHQEIFTLSLFSFYIIFYQIFFSKIRVNIHNIFLFGFAYFMFLYPFFYSLDLVNIEGYSAGIFNKSIKISVLGLVIYIISYYSFFNSKLDTKYFQADINKKKYNGINKQLYLLSLIIFSAYFTIFGQGIFNRNVILFTGLLFLFYLIPKKHYLLIIIIFLIFVFLTLTSSSGRRDIIKIILIFLFYMQIYYGNFSILILFTGLCSTILCMGVITAIRTFSIHWEYNRDIGIIDTIKNPYYLKVFRGAGSYLDSALILGDFGVAYNNYIFIIKHITEIGYLYGQSFIRLFTFIIPRSLWPAKPIDVQMLIVQLNTDPFYTGGTSQSISLVGEVFWNFGYTAVIFSFFFMGIINKKIDNISLSPSPYSLLIIMSLIPFFMLMWRGSFSTSFIYALANITILLICLIASKSLLQKK